jgi:glucose/arabinose dehydrogenase
MMKLVSTVALALSTCSVQVNNPPPPPGTLHLALVAQGLDQPVYVTAPPGDAQRLFVVEQGGRVRIVRNGAVLATPFLDLSTQVSRGGEQGLLSIAFDPSYASNGRVYASYTNTAGDTRILRYVVSGVPDVANQASADTILAVDQPFSNHNGGLIASVRTGICVGRATGVGRTAVGQLDTALLGKLRRCREQGRPTALLIILRGSWRAGGDQAYGLATRGGSRSTVSPTTCTSAMGQGAGRR